MHPPCGLQLTVRRNLADLRHLDDPMRGNEARELFLINPKGSEEYVKYKLERTVLNDSLESDKKQHSGITDPLLENNTLYVPPLLMQKVCPS